MKLHLWLGWLVVTAMSVSAVHSGHSFPPSRSDLTFDLAFDRNMNDNMVMGKRSSWGWLDALTAGPVGTLWDLAKTVASRHPGCIARVVCETHRMTENHTGMAYLFTTFLSSASSFLLAEAFQRQIGLGELTEAARVGRQSHNCYPLQCQLF